MNCVEVNKYTYCDVTRFSKFDGISDSAWYVFYGIIAIACLFFLALFLFPQLKIPICLIPQLIKSNWRALKNGDIYHSDEVRDFESSRSTQEEFMLAFEDIPQTRDKLPKPCCCIYYSTFPSKVTMIIMMLVALAPLLQFVLIPLDVFFDVVYAHYYLGGGLLDPNIYLDTFNGYLIFFFACINVLFVPFLFHAHLKNIALSLGGKSHRSFGSLLFYRFFLACEMVLVDYPQMVLQYLLIDMLVTEKIIWWLLIKDGVKCLNYFARIIVYFANCCGSDRRLLIDLKCGCKETVGKLVKQFLLVWLTCLEISMGVLVISKTVGKVYHYVSPGFEMDCLAVNNEGQLVSQFLVNDSLSERNLDWDCFRTYDMPFMVSAIAFPAALIFPLALFATILAFVGVLLAFVCFFVCFCAFCFGFNCFPNANSDVARRAQRTGDAAGFAALALIGVFGGGG